MKRIVLSFFAFILCVTPLLADTTSQIKDQFNSRIDSVIKIVIDKSVETEIRNQNIIKAISPMFDFELMAKLSLGGKAWNSLDAHQKQLFVDLYVARMKKSYSEKLDAYTNETIIVNEIQMPKPNRAVIITDLISGDEKISINYKMYEATPPKEKKDKWLIYDVDISGVSVVQTDRAQFAEVLKSNTIEYLMDQMNTKR